MRLQSPMSDQTERLRRARERRRREKASQSLPRDALRNYDDSDTETRAERGRKRGKGRGRSRERKSRSEERERMSEREEFMNRDKLMRVGKRRKEVVETFESESEDSDREVILPIPSLTQRLPRPKEIWEEESDDDWGMAAEYRELRKEEKPETEWERSWGDDSRESKDTGLNEKEDNDEQSSSVKRPLPSVGVIDLESQRKPFSFLASTLSIDQLGDDESDSEGSHSDGSVSAASISALSLVTTQPGPWFIPSQQRLAQVMKENRQADRAWVKK